MESWHRIIGREIRRAARVAVLGVGNAGRGDDAAGAFAARDLLAANRPSSDRALVLDTGEAPENFTGVVRSFAADFVLLVDCAAAGRPPGTVFLVDPAAVADEDISTHRLPLSRLARYLEQTMECRVGILGIEPASFEAAAALSPAVARSVREIVAFLGRALAAK